jgi:diacylglycerol O-acyltransferase / wax synthase
MSASDQLTALDATFLELEQSDESALMHIGGALLFEPEGGTGVPTIDELRRHLTARMGLLPRYRQKLGSPRTGRFSWPYWEDDEHFELEAHVRHATLPSPGGEQELMDWISDYYSHRLDRNRPLWELVLLDGLADGRWALVTKTHHCLVDGVGSVGVMDMVFGPEPAPAPAENGHPVVAGGGLHLPLPQPPASVRQASDAGLTAVRHGVHAVTHPREALERSREVIDLLIRDELFGAPRSSLNVPVGATRRLATVHAEVEDLHDIRAALGGKLNDVVLCAATGGLRELLIARGEEPPRRGLRAMVPVNIRRESDNGELGNRISSLFVELPVAEPDPLRRYELVRAEAKARKDSGQAYGGSVLLGLTELAPPVLHVSLARALYAKRLFNITITNVPGSPEPVHVLGSRMLDVIPLVPLAAEHALGIAVLSYNGRLTFGLSADRGTVPDLDVVEQGIAASLDELKALAKPAAVAH